MKFGLIGFTSGSVCVAPGLSTAMLHAIKRGDLAEARRIREVFMPFEDLRDAHSPLRTLHDGLRLADIANTGPMWPYLSNIEDSKVLAAIGHEARRLLAADRSAVAKAA
jgi:dihydrodipicolinate synthase/N-acetylneuraminate lyase